MSAPDSSGRYWIDVTVLFLSFARAGNRPSGIPRVVHEIVEAARRGHDSVLEIRLVRFDNVYPGFREVSWPELDRLMEAASQSPPPVKILKNFLRRTFPGPVALAESAQGLARRAYAKLRRSIPIPAGLGAARVSGYRHPFSDGDTWMNFGNWWQPQLVDALLPIRRQVRLRTAALIHDVIPLLYPEFFDGRDVQAWRRQLPRLPDIADMVLVSSENTARDVAEVAPAMADRIRRIPFGDSFGAMGNDAGAVQEHLDALAIDRPYVLMVGTIEVRKNHVLAFRAWRNLARRRTDLPLLVIAGRWGWKTADLRDQIEVSGGIDGLVRVVEGPSDVRLAALYRGAMFTLYPSHYEGWGLPVRESLAYGRICLAARNSSIVEAGSDLADYFEDNCQLSLEAEVARLIGDESARNLREKDIGVNFSAMNWDDCWGAVKSYLNDNAVILGRAAHE